MKEGVSQETQSYLTHGDHVTPATNAQYTPPTQTRRNCQAESRRRQRCVLGLKRKPKAVHVIAIATSTTLLARRRRGYVDFHNDGGGFQ